MKTRDKYNKPREVLKELRIAYEKQGFFLKKEVLRILCFFLNQTKYNQIREFVLNSNILQSILFKVLRRVCLLS